MSDITHQIHINRPKADVARALHTIEGLASWWTRTTEGSTAPGELIAFRFGSHLTEARVNELTEDRVAWTFENSNPDWQGTRVTFELEAVESDTPGARTLLRFGHLGWREQGDFFGHCSMKWATFLLSLRDQVERGEGRPFPNDLAI